MRRLTKEELKPYLDAIREMDLAETSGTVREILQGVKEGGDAALVDYTVKFDRVRPDPLIVTEEEYREAFEAVGAELVQALKKAAGAIEEYHREESPRSWWKIKSDGALAGKMASPLDRVGVYVPGGRAAYPSSVLMNTIPARLAGVKEIVAVSPPGPDGRLNPLVLVAARLSGVSLFVKVGGAQAVAALAFGTETVPRVQKIVGPGNRYVTEAKRQLYGVVGLDMLAGPSEVMVVADESTPEAEAAADLLAQAEHDPDAVAILVSTSESKAGAIVEEVRKRLKELPRREIAAEALARRGAVVCVSGSEEAVEVVNFTAPEHLSVLTSNPFEYLGRVKAGAVFLGHGTPQALGDYIAGTNHVLPTGGTAAFFSALGVEDFVQRTSFIAYPSGVPGDILKAGAAIAEAEGLSGHARAMMLRYEKEER